MATGYGGADVAPGRREILYPLAPVVPAQGDDEGSVLGDTVAQANRFAALPAPCVDIVHQGYWRRELYGEYRDPRDLGTFADENALDRSAKRPHDVDSPKRATYQPADHRRALLAIVVLVAIDDVSADVIDDETGPEQAQSLQEGGGDRVGEAVAANDGVGPESPDGNQNDPHSM